MILIVLLYALFGGSFLIMKVLVGHAPHAFLVGCRMTIAGLVLLSYQYFHPKEEFRFQKKHLFWYAQITFFGVYLTYMLRFWALHYLSAAKMSFLFNLSPFMASYYSYLFFKERMTTKQWIGLVVGILGLIPILLTSTKTELCLGEFMYISWPELAVIAAVAAHSYSWIVMRKLVKENSYSPMMVNGISMTCGGLMGLATSYCFEEIPAITNPVEFWGLLGLIILTSNIICHNLYGFLLKRYTATFISFAGFLGPIFTALYGYLLLNETISWHYYVSGSVVFIGLWLFYQDELGKKHPAPLDTSVEGDLE